MCAWGDCEGAPRGTVFTANDEEHTVVSRRSDICRSQTCGRLRLTTKAFDGEQASQQMLIYAYFMHVCTMCIINRQGERFWDRMGRSHE